jgi:uncharacterized protein Yka (UPF0111/DUF47 family)
MTTKDSIISVLGERALLLPRQLAEALAANERLKMSFTLLQAAERHADHPDDPVPDFTAERRAAGLDGEFPVDPARSRRAPDGGLQIEGVHALRGLILADLAAMQAPLALAGVTEAEALELRARALEGALPTLEEDRVPRGVISSMTSARRDGSIDSLHLLVMDLHRAINGLQGSLAEETLDGARVWRLADEDRPLVRAFMSGLNRTAPLKFDHPGLGTTATRIGAKLTIQNDLGTTDAHVLMLNVEALSATLIYTDVHVRRLEFFQSLLEPFAVRWTERRERHSGELSEGGDFSLSVGRFEATDAGDLAAYLAHIGSRLVFLIDWNHARKRLREIIHKDDVVALLKWAADQEIGHRAFLQLGGERLIHEAMEFAQHAPLRYGESLDETLGREAALDYLQFVLREATVGLRERRSERFIRDAIKAELARRLHTAHSNLLGMALTHAERVFDLAAGVHEGLLRHADRESARLLERAAQRARKWEQEGDALVSRIRSLARRTPKPQVYSDLMHQADEAADGLEEAAFLMAHLPALAPPARLMEPLRALGALLLAGAQESVKMFEAASHVSREGTREDLQDFFAAVDRIIAIEHETDLAERAVTTALLQEECELRTLHLVSSLSGALEASADGLALSALALRDYLLNDVMTV